jgi:SAM-dependent methyltransferase
MDQRALRKTSRTAVRTAVVWEVLREALAGLAAAVETVQVLDIGGGTGGFAVPLAELGYSVTVVDPSPDSLAALERRAAETNTAHLVRGLQGDASDVAALVGARSVDAVLCHSVLEVVDDPAESLRAVADVLRPGGVASILTANRAGATIARVAAGRLAEARELIESASGASGHSDPLRRRFTLADLHELVDAVGLTPVSAHGVRIFADAAPQALLELDPQALDDLLVLERTAADDPAYLALATSLHVLATRSAPGAS